MSPPTPQAGHHRPHQSCAHLPASFTECKAGGQAEWRHSLSVAAFLRPVERGLPCVACAGEPSFICCKYQELCRHQEHARAGIRTQQTLSPQTRAHTQAHAQAHTYKERQRQSENTHIHTHSHTGMCTHFQRGEPRKSVHSPHARNAFLSKVPREQ